MFDFLTPGFFRRLQQLKIHTRRTFLGSRQGSHRSLRKGHGLEFSDFRAYTPGDDYRHIDWGVYGRTDRLYVRQFQEEQDLNIMLMLDSSSSMAYPEASGKFELAKDLTLALGYVALSDGDSVTFSVLGQRNSPKLSGAQALSRAIKELSDIAPKGTYNLLTEVRAATASHRIPGKCFLVSDFLFPLEQQFEALDFLRSRNFEICLVQILAPGELSLDIEGTQTVIDSESGIMLKLSLDRNSLKEYAVHLATHIEHLEQYCHKAGITHVLLSSEEKPADILLTKFPELGILK